jgi:hypothetical protein
MASFRIVHSPHHNYDPGSEGLPLAKTDRQGERGMAGGKDDLRMICLCPADPAEGKIRADFLHSEGSLEIVVWLHHLWKTRQFNLLNETVEKGRELSPVG